MRNKAKKTSLALLLARRSEVSLHLAKNLPGVFLGEYVETSVFTVGVSRKVCISYGHVRFFFFSTVSTLKPADVNCVPDLLL